MKVLKPSNDKHKDDPWWIGKTATCSNCGAELSFERGDKVTRLMSGDHEIGVWIACPECGMTLSLDRK